MMIKQALIIGLFFGMILSLGCTAISSTEETEGSPMYSSGEMPPEDAPGMDTLTPPALPDE